MTDIVQPLALIVVGGFAILLVSAVGFVAGRFVGEGAKTLLVSVLTALGFAHDTAVTVAVTVVLIATNVSLAISFIVFFSITGLFDRGLGRDLLSLIGIYRLILMVGGGVVLLITAAGIVVGARGRMRADCPDEVRAAGREQRGGQL